MRPAGSMNVLRKANLEQDSVRFTISYVSPPPEMGSAIGLAIANICPLSGDLSDHALVVMPGCAAGRLATMGMNRTPDANLEGAIVMWLKRVIRPGIGRVSICSGALVAARAGLLDGYDCTTHHACTADLQRRAAPHGRASSQCLVVRTTFPFGVEPNADGNGNDIVIFYNVTKRGGVRVT